MALQTSTDTLQAAVLQHVNRYRMTVSTAVASESGLRGLGHQRIKTLLRQMCLDGDIGRATLYRQRPYYYIARANSGDASRPDGPPLGPLSEMAKVRNYAMLAFCCLDLTRRTRLTSEEMKTHFPAVFRVGLPLNYYVDASQETPRLGFLRIDTGGRGRWDRVLAKCQHDLHQHATRPGLKPFIEQNAFEITLITPLPQKAKRLAAEISRSNHPCRQCVRVSVLPDLLNLIAPPPTRG